MNYIKISWRNIWRNKRRTIITSTSVMFAVAFAILMRSFQEGTYDLQIDNMVRMLSGHYQIHNKGFWDDKIIDNALLINNELIDSLSKNKDIESISPRLQYFGFVSTGKVTREGFIVGAFHQKEDPVSKISNKIIAGEMINNTDKSIVLAEGLAKFLGVTTIDTIVTKKQTDNGFVYDTTLKTRIINDTIVILGQGYHGSTAVGKFHVKGIVKLPIYDLNKRGIYMSLPSAQELFNVPNMVTSLNIIIKNSDKQAAIFQSILPAIDNNNMELLTWQQMQPELVQQIESDRGSGAITIYLLYMIIGFGIFGTVIMMTNERKREFAIMIAIGMRKGRLAINVATELLYMGVLGSLAGIILALPLVLYFYYNPIEFTGELAKSYEQYGWEPIMPIATKLSLFINQAVIVFSLFALTGLYPITRILKMDVSKAIHS